MISSRTSKDLGLLTATSVSAHHTSLGRHLLHHPARHLQGFIRLARRRRTFAVALLAASVSGLATVAATVATVHQLHVAQVQPLAPAPAAAGAALAATATKPRQSKHPLFRSLIAVNPLHAAANSLHGLASWYGSVLHGHKTASGETFDEAELTACHRTLPFGTMVRVTDEASSKSVVVRINDRGVLNADRVIDLSAAAADKLGILRRGLAHVHLEILKPAKPNRQLDSTEIN